MSEPVVPANMADSARMQLPTGFEFKRCSTIIEAVLPGIHSTTLGSLDRMD